MNTIRISETDKNLLYEIADWTYLHTSDLFLREHAQRICRCLANDDLELARDSVANLRSSFPDFWAGNPNKEAATRDLRRRLTELISE